ncbi:hypothetical protein DV738_g3142, partial [Chaetothyriales sp. CBS 135597]
MMLQQQAQLPPSSLFLHLSPPRATADKDDKEEDETPRPLRFDQQSWLPSYRHNNINNTTATTATCTPTPHQAPPGFSIRKATLADAPAIAQLGRSVFTDSFGFSIPSNDMRTFLDEVYDLPAIEAEISSPTKHFFNTTEPCLAEIPGLVELQRLYVHGDCHGRGVGKALVGRVELLARDRLGYSNIWLGVWEGNFVAQRVYEALGYERVGEHEFTMGRCVQIDWIMVKPLLN